MFVADVFLVASLERRFGLPFLGFSNEWTVESLWACTGLARKSVPS